MQVGGSKFRPRSHFHIAEQSANLLAAVVRGIIQTTNLNSFLIECQKLIDLNYISFIDSFRAIMKNQSKSIINKDQPEVAVNERPAPRLQLLRLPQVLQVYPVSRSTWYAGVKSGIYPRGIQLSRRTVAWAADEIDELAKARPSA